MRLSVNVRIYACDPGIKILTGIRIKKDFYCCIVPYHGRPFFGHGKTQHQAPRVKYLDQSCPGGYKIAHSHSYA